MGVTNFVDGELVWQAEMLSHERFGHEFWALMTSTRAFDHDKTNDAFGLVHGEYEGHPMLWYAGSDIDASSYAITLPALGLDVTCFSNDPAQSCQNRAMAALEVVLPHVSPGP